MPYSALKQERSEPNENFMTLTGTGYVISVPDTAVIHIGLQTTSDEVTSAQQENAMLSQAVLESLQQFEISEIKTYQYTVNKIYDYENNIKIDKGYSVRNIFEIRMHNMDQVGMMIDTAVNNGANIVSSVDFELSDSNSYYLQALNLAVMNAVQKAKSIAGNLGLTTMPVPTHITENSTSPKPYTTLAMRESDITTPIAPGNTQIESSVTIDFIY